MNRRRFLVALGIVALLVMFIGAKIIVFKRPYVVGKMLPTPFVARASRASGPEVRASQNFVIARNIAWGDTLFDLKTGTRRLAYGETLVAHGDLVAQGDWLWEVLSQRPPRLQLTDSTGATRSYDLPVEATEELTDSYFQEVRVVLARNCVELMLFDHNAGRFCRWNQSSGVLELDVRSAFSEAGYRALARDGQTVVAAGFHQLYHISTRTGRITRRVPFAGFTTSDQGSNNLPRELSPFGSYALYRAETVGAPQQNLLLDTKTGRTLWSFTNAPQVVAVFAADESRIAVPVPARKIWEVRALPAGNVLFTLPLLPDVQTGAFSPDNATFYSIAGNTLYRQRAR